MMKRTLWNLICVSSVFCCVLLVPIHTSVGQGFVEDPSDGTRMVEYVMAAPRAAIVPRPGPCPVDCVNCCCCCCCCRMYGAAHNFPRRNGRLFIPAGTVVFFRESPELEGVWYERTYGHLATGFELQIRDRLSGTEEWITLGRDGAGATRFGPSIGTADVGVRHYFEHPGVYYLRANIGTKAAPMPLDNAVEPCDCHCPCPMAAHDEDTVYVVVIVRDGPVPVSATTEDPNRGAAAPLEPEGEAAEPVDPDENGGRVLQPRRR